jgi:hypothetical protein
LEPGAKETLRHARHTWVAFKHAARWEQVWGFEIGWLMGRCLRVRTQEIMGRRLNLRRVLGSVKNDILHGADGFTHAHVQIVLEWVSRRCAVYDLLCYAKTKTGKTIAVQQERP